MSELWSGLLIGAFISIPVGVFVNLISPAVARRIERRNAQAADKRAREDKAFELEVIAYSKDRPSLYAYLLEVLIRIAYIGALFGVFAGGLAITGQLLPYLGIITQAIFGLSQLIGLVGTIIVLNIARPAVQTIREVRAVLARN